MPSLIGSVVDTILFFGIAFAATFAFLDTGLRLEDSSLAFPVGWFGMDVPLWVSLAFGDFCVKILVGLAMLVPYGALLNALRPAESLG